MADYDIELLRRLGALPAITADERNEARAARDYEEGERFEASHAVPKLTAEEIAALVSREARDAVIGFEVTSRAYYDRYYVHPEAPGGSSGITIGIGYDVGQMKKEQVRKDWEGLIPAADLALLLTACGQHGDVARGRLGEFRHVTVPWDTALKVFDGSTIPRYGQMVLETYPNTVDLAGDAFGALFSLIYNRGTSLVGARRVQMANIYGELQKKDFGKVPGEFRAMADLWRGKPKMEGVVIRRAKEAVLFQRGLDLLASRPRAVAAATSSGPLESAGPAGDLGDGAYYEEMEVADGEVLESANAWDAVSWPADADAPDYAHLAAADPALLGSVFQFGQRELMLLLEANGFEPKRENGRFAFALRGAQLAGGANDTKPQLSQVDRAELTLRDVRPDHASQRCVIGVFDGNTGRLSGFSASTVPHRRAVLEYKQTRRSGNLMMTGLYSFTVGWHKQGKPTQVPGCLTEAGRQKAVWRSVNDLRYDLIDPAEDRPLHGDNLHPASNDRSATFSSYGCLVVNGRYTAQSDDRSVGTHSGEWGQFRKALGLNARGTGDHGRVFDVVVLTGLEAAIARSLRDSRAGASDPAAGRLLGRLRQGSSGSRVRALQRALGVAETGVFGPKLAASLVTAQRARNGGKGDGIYSPATEQLLGFKVFSEPVAVAAAGQHFESVGGSGGSELDDLYIKFGLVAENAKRAGAGNDNFESLGDTVVEYGVAALRATGVSVVRDLEIRLKDYICGAEARNALVDASGLRQRLDGAVKYGQDGVEAALLYVLRNIPGAALFPDTLLEGLITILMRKIVVPAFGTPAMNMANSANQQCDWLCKQWSQNIDQRYAPTLGPGAPALAPQVPTAAAAHEKSPVLFSVTSSPGPMPGAPGVDEIFSALKHATLGKVDAEAFRRSALDLRKALETGGHVLDRDQQTTLLAAICDTELLSGPSNGKLFQALDAALAALDAKPFIEREARARIEAFEAELVTSRADVPAKDADKLLEAVRKVRMFDTLSHLADRLVTRDPGLRGVATPHYAQGLIDSGRLQAAIDLLGALKRDAADGERCRPLETPQLNRANGLIGRAHKQIYVNFVRSTGEARELAAGKAIHLVESAKAYALGYDPQDAGGTNWHAINLVAVGQLANRDSVDLGLQADKSDFKKIAADVVGALEPAAETSDDPWKLATVGEAYLALGDYDKASKYMALYAKHPKIDAFQLNSTIRQLREVWRIEAGTSGAGAILAGLMNVMLAEKPGGFANLQAAERRALSTDAKIEFGERFETITTGSDQVTCATIRQVVACSNAVLAIQKRDGDRWVNHGTAFIVDGGALLPAAKEGVHYLLTNAHVMWDTGKGDAKGHQRNPSAVEYTEIRLVSEPEESFGRNDAFGCARVVWQSPSNKHDAVLFELDRPIPGGFVKPLEIAGTGDTLNVAEGSTAGTSVVVIGHAGGRGLTLGYKGSIQENRAVLVDMGLKDGDEPTFLHYTTPTEPGNSGSPILSPEKRWRVVGLHHAGFDGSGRSKLNAKPGYNLANEGIWIESIRKAIASDPELQPPPEPGKPRRALWGRGS